MNPVMLVDNKAVNAKTIFGKDAEKVISTCKAIYDRYMYPAENGRPSNPAITIGHVHPFNTPVGKTWRECVNDWLNDHPAEKAQYETAKANWEAEGAKLWKELFGIAKRRHIRIEWLGTDRSCCFPDQFMVRKGGDVIAMIQC